MRSIYNPSLEDTLPESILDEQLRAAARALEPQLAQLSLLSREAMHLPRIDELSGTVLDLLAEQFHLDFFDPLNLDDDQKKALIRESIATHRQKGTIAAVERVAKQFLTNPKIVELGDFKFKIDSEGFKANSKSLETFLKMLYDAKNVRSWLISIDTYIPLDKKKLYIGGAKYQAGVIDLKLSKPPSIKVKGKVGVCLHHVGLITDKIPKPRKSLVRGYVGCCKVFSGAITLKTNPPVNYIYENPTADKCIVGIGR